jgi:hypothetical protein
MLTKEFREEVAYRTGNIVAVALEVLNGAYRIGTLYGFMWGVASKLGHTVAHLLDPRPYRRALGGRQPTEFAQHGVGFLGQQLIVPCIRLECDAERLSVGTVFSKTIAEVGE